MHDCMINDLAGPGAALSLKIRHHQDSDHQRIQGHANADQLPPLFLRLELSDSDHLGYQVY